MPRHLLPTPHTPPCSTVRKTESSLKRLKARQQGGEGGAAPDTDKMIALQLFLDVQEFGRQAKQVRSCSWLRQRAPLL